MGGKKRNAYAAFVDEYSKRNGITIQEAFKVCGNLWAKLPEEERNRFRGGRGTSVILDCLGRAVTSAEEEIRLEEERAFRMKQFVETKLAKNVGHFDVDVSQEFVLGHVNYFCKTAQGQVVPAEIAVVRFSIADGVKDSFHEILRPKTIPEGYLRETIQRAEKTHNIPHNDRVVGERNSQKIKVNLYRFLSGETGAIEPVFCLQSEVEDFAKVFKALLDEEGAEDVEVFDAGVILSEIQCRIKDPDNPVATPSVDAANHYLEEDTFLYKTSAAVGCLFHTRIDNVKFCSLNVVKRRVWSICEKSTRVLGLTLEVCKHLPDEEVRQGPDERKQFVGSEDEEEMDEFQKAAVVKKSKNPFGTKVPKCGTMGGYTSLPERDPTFEIQEKIKDAKKKLGEDLLNMPLCGAPTRVACPLFQGPIRSNARSSKEQLPACESAFAASEASGAPSGTDDFFSSTDEEEDAASVVSATSAASAVSAVSRRSRPKIWANFVTRGRDPPPPS